MTTLHHAYECDELFDPEDDYRVTDACYKCFEPETDMGGTSPIIVIDSNEDGNDIEFRFDQEKYDNAEIGVWYECEYVSSYRCNDGYYGLAEYRKYDTEAEMVGCIKCPTLDGATVDSDVSQTFADHDNQEYTDITSCYASSGITYQDSAGKYKFTNDCYYSE